MIFIDTQIQCDRCKALRCVTLSVAASHRPRLGVMGGGAIGCVLPDGWVPADCSGVPTSTHYCPECAEQAE